MSSEEGLEGGGEGNAADIFIIMILFPHFRASSISKKNLYLRVSYETANTTFDHHRDIIWLIYFGCMIDSCSELVARLLLSINKV